MAPNDILFETRGALGVATLNRPEQLNALTPDMARRLHAQLDAWAVDDDVAAVAIQGAGEKAFCAGGDIRWISETGRAKPEEAEAFYRDEYRLNAAIKRFAKPYIAFMDGVVMGGGAGVSVHGRYRVGGDRTMFAMPETGIGLAPDIGGSFFLSRLPRRIGWWLALTGARIHTPDCLFAHLVDYYIRSDRAEAVIEALAAADYSDNADETVCEILATNAAAAEAAPLKDHVEAIERFFAAESVAALMAELEAGDGWSLAQAEAIRGKSPLSTRVTWRLLGEGAALPLEQCLALEYRVVCAALRGHDFHEGVRAAVIDKDRNPAWSPATLAEVDDAMVAASFQPPASGDLTFD